MPQGEVGELAEHLHDLLLAPLLAGGQPLRSLQVLQPAHTLRLADHYPPSFRSWRAFFPWGACPFIDRGTYSSTALRASQNAPASACQHFSMSARSSMAEGSFYGEAFSRGERFAIEHEQRTHTKQAEMLRSRLEQATCLHAELLYLPLMSLAASLRSLTPRTL
jgi:hypothetical protein